MQQLSMIDAFMLAAETENQTLQMATLSMLDGSEQPDHPPVTRQVVRDLVAQRIHLLPALRRKLVQVPLELDHPYWVEDPELDLDHHVRDLTLPAPGDQRQLADAVATAVTTQLDRSRPLWEIHVIMGLADGQVAILLKLHHASVDGVSALDLHSVLFDSAPSGRPIPPPTPIAGEDMPPRWHMLRRGVASLPGQTKSAVVDGITSLPYLDHLMPFRVVPGVGTLAGVTRRLRELTGSNEGGVLGSNLPRAPKTVLDRPLTSPHRRLAFARASMEEAKRIKNHFGVTLNDVIVATLAGAMREWLQLLDDLPAEPLVALIPISVRPQDAEPGGNLVQVMFVELPTNEPDAERRLRLTHDALRIAKDQHQAVPAAAMRAADKFLMPALFVRASRAAAALSRLGGVTSNVMISNVPGPAQTMYFAGARVDALYPVGGQLDGFGFCTVAFSYNGSFDLGFAVGVNCPASPWQLAHAYERSHREMVGLVPPTAP